MSHFPYPGLRPFRKDETDIFFGREEHVCQLLKLLKKLENTSHFVAVIGPSGCGKSSLVHTGLLASLNRGELTTAALQNSWHIAELHPGTRPFEHLTNALLADTAWGPHYVSQFADSSDASFTLQTHLRCGSHSIEELRQQLPWANEANLLLLVDQFEEIFRFATQNDEAHEEAKAFIALLLKSCQLPNVYVIITMRSDFLGDCVAYHSLPEVINQGLFLVPRLQKDQLRTAIEAPARILGGRVEAALVKQLLEEAGNDSDQLPLLQHALMRMWHLALEENPQQVILSLKHYETIGGRLAAALSQHADEAYLELGPAQYKITEILFRNLTELSGDLRDSRRPVEIRQIAAQVGIPWERVAAIIEMFRQTGRCFVTPGEEVALEANTVINITHESLIREWQRLKNWAKNEAVCAALYQRLEIDAQLWAAGEAELWHGLNLNNALVWRNLERPNKVWASRYGKHFDLAMRFLEASESHQQEEQQEAEATQQRELQRQRARQQVFLTLVALVVVALLAVFEFFQVRYAMRAQTMAEQAQQVAVAAEQGRSLNLFESQLTHATLLARVGDYAMVKQLLKKTHELDSKLRPARLHIRNLLAWFGELMGGVPQQIYEGANAQLSPVALSPDGRVLAVGGDNGTLVLFDVQTGKLLQRLEGHTKYVNALVFHPQGQWLASAGDDKRIILWSLPTSQKQIEWEAPDKVYALAVTKDGTSLVSGGPDQNITVWEVATGLKQRTLTGHTDSIAEGGLAFSPNGELLASASYDDTARLWKVASGETLHVLRGHTNDVENVTFSPDGKLLATSSDDTSIRLWDVTTGQPLRMLNGHLNRVYGLRFIKGGHYLVSGSYDSTLRVWDTYSGVTLRVLQGHLGRVIGLVNQDGQVFSASADGTVRRWDISLPYQHIVELDSLVPHAVAIAPDGRHVAVGFANGSLRLYSLPEVRMANSQSAIKLVWENKTAHTGTIERLAFSPDSTLLASASSDSLVKLWQVTEGELQQTFTGHADKVTAVAFSPDNRTLASSSEDGQIGLFQVGTAEKRFIPNAHEGKMVLSVTFDSSGKQLLSGGRDSEAMQIWNVAEDPPTRLQSFTNIQRIRWAAISPDNQWVAGVGRDQLVQLYSVSENQEKYRLMGHEQTIFRAIFSPDASTLATAGGDATLRFWDLSNGSELLTLRLPTLAEKDSPLWDFDFRCTPQNCWIAVPLTHGELILYEMGKVF